MQRKGIDYANHTWKRGCPGRPDGVRHRNEHRLLACLESFSCLGFILYPPPPGLVLFLHSVFLITFMSFCSSVSCNLEIPESLFHICLLILILKGAFLLRLPDCWFLYSALVNLFFSGLDGTASIWQWTDFLLLIPAFRNGFLSIAHESLPIGQECFWVFYIFFWMVLIKAHI